MSQDFTDDCFYAGHQAQTDLQNIEDNFAALKSTFSGTTAPANPVAGMFWYDTTNHILKVRDEANNVWLSVWDLANNKPVITNLSDEITDTMVASANKDGAAATACMRTLGTGQYQACAGNDARLSDTRTPTDASVSQSKLKTSYGTVSVTVNYPSTLQANRVLPGGQYGFYPQIYSSGLGVDFLIGKTFSTASYTTNIGFYSTYTPESTATVQALQRYVTSSGEVYWIFILRNKETKQNISIWAAPDHPCFGNGGKPNLISHPFGDFDESIHEIIVVNPSKEQLAEIEAKMDVDNDDEPDFSLTEVIERYYEIDENSRPLWPTKEVTVGLPKGYDWTRAKEGATVTPIKKVIPKPDYIIVKSLKKK